MIDFHHVSARHDEIHARLENWARWVAVRPQTWKSQPMFRNYRSHAWQWHPPEIVIPVNSLEAHEIERAVSHLPEKHRAAIRWVYVFCKVHPNAVQRHLGLTKEALLNTINDGRDMLKNRLKQGVACYE